MTQWNDEALEAAWVAFMRKMQIAPEYTDLIEGEEKIPSPADIGGVELYAGGEQYMSAIKAAIRAHNIKAGIDKTSPDDGDSA